MQPGQCFRKEKASPQKDKRAILWTKETSPLLLFDYMYFQIIKIDAFHKIVFGKTGLFMSFKIIYVGIQPDRFGQIKMIAYLVKGMKYFMRSGIVGIIFHNNIL